MGLLAASTIEVRPGAGSDTNGGGCSNVAGTNLSLQNAAAYSATDIVTNGTTTITSASSNWGTNVVDNWIYIAGGTGAIAATRYRVVTRVSASNLTLDRTTGLTAGTGATGNVGGALATFGGLGALLGAVGVSGMVAWIKSGTDTITSATLNVSGGIITVSSGVSLFGYNTVRGDLNGSIGSANRPVMHAGAITGVTLIGISGGTGRSANNIAVNGNGNASVNGFNDGVVFNCTASNCVIGFNIAAQRATFCSALVCGTGFSGTQVTCLYCFTNDCTTSGYTGSSASNFVHCVSINDAVCVTLSSADAAIILSCTLHEATGDGITGMGLAGRVINSLFTSNTGDAIDFNNATTFPTTALIVNNAFRANGTVYETSPPTAQITGSVTPSGDPYTNEATDDLSPDNTTGEGASLHNAGLDVFGQTDNRDIGAVQHADPASGASGARTLFIGGGLAVAA